MLFIEGMILYPNTCSCFKLNWNHLVSFWSNFRSLGKVKGFRLVHNDAIASIEFFILVSTLSSIGFLELVWSWSFWTLPRRVENWPIWLNWAGSISMTNSFLKKLLLTRRLAYYILLPLAGVKIILFLLATLLN